MNSNEDIWKPIENLKNAPEVIKEFHKKFPKAINLQELEKKFSILQQDTNLQIENISGIIPLQADLRSINILIKESTLFLFGQIKKISIGIKIYNICVILYFSLNCT